MYKLLLLLLGTSFFVYSFSQEIKSSWLDSALVIDGNNSDWKNKNMII